MPRLLSGSPDDDVLVANDADYKIGIEYSERILKESLALMKRLDLPVTQLDAVSRIVIGQVGASVHARFEVAQREKRQLVERYHELVGDDLEDYAPVPVPRGRLRPVPRASAPSDELKLPRNVWDMSTDDLKAVIEKLEKNGR